MWRGARAVVLFLCAVSAAADGGRVRLRQFAGPFAITVFTAPEPLTAGPADVSVMVQDRASGDVLLDAAVDVRLTAPGEERARSYPGIPGTNRLLKSAAVDLVGAGQWGLEVVVRRAGEIVSVSGPLPVEARASRLNVIWPFLAAPPLAVALFALRGRLRGRQREE